jgi:hypothetical protein
LRRSRHPLNLFGVLSSPAVYTNSFDQPAPRRLVVIAIDTVNTGFLDLSWADAK